MRILLVLIALACIGCNEPAQPKTFEDMTTQERMDELVRQLSKQEIRDPFAN
jgi:hypothetical protein